ncbi:MAG: MFS transporter [Verrucomicrobiales bacterium]|nr:MFS transporter [Verrucomicrobiales bacterium]
MPPNPTIPQRSEEPESLRDLSPTQWKSGIAAWLGWLFDGLDMHLYTLVAATFVSQLLNVASTADDAVKQKSSWIQAAFLVGWALGGAFFGRVGDRLGRSRALSLTVLTYALFTGLSFFAQTWWHLLIFRFVAALGIGGEWAVGSTLLAETWPKRWRPWIAAVLQTGVNLGVLLACLTGYVLSGTEPRYVFLVGIVPALLVFWIRRHVPEPAEWHAAKASGGRDDSSVTDLFRGTILRTTLLTIVVCACSLSGWWAFMFWHPQHLRHLPEVAAMEPAAINRLVSTTFAAVIASSIVGNFFAGWVARLFGFRVALVSLFLGFSVTMWVGFSVDRSAASLSHFWLPAVGFWSGVFGLFTMFLPPLFPTLLRTTGAGFCYNVGRIAAAAGTVYSGALTHGGNFREILFLIGFLFLIAAVVSLIMPSPEQKDRPA